MEWFGPEYEFQTEGSYQVKVTAFAEQYPIAECTVPVTIGETVENDGFILA